MTFSPAPRPALKGYGPEHFDHMFAASDDPWLFQSRWYEQRKRALTLACLPGRRYLSGYEPGCANGELSAALASRCDQLLVSDGSARAVAIAKARLAESAHVNVLQAWLPEQWPEQRFDLIVLSEFLFYLPLEAVNRIAASTLASLLPGGTVLACHWRHPVPDSSVSGDQAHEALHVELGLPKICSVLEPDLRLDVWSTSPSVARQEGFV